MKRLPQDEWNLPETGAGDYLIEAMFRLGPTRSNGMAEEGAGWTEIAAFAQATGRVDEPWELEALFDLCRAYLAARVEGENPFSRSPVEIAGGAEHIDRAAISKHMDAGFSSLMRGRKRR